MSSSDDKDVFGLSSSFIENRGEKTYVEKDKSLAVRNELQMTLTEERITNNRLIMNILFHFLIVLFTLVMVYYKVFLFTIEQIVPEGRERNIISFSILDFAFTDASKAETFSFAYSCAYKKINGDISKCKIAAHCIPKGQPEFENIFDNFKDNICDEFNTLSGFGIFVN
jgi:hypothetical protein